MLGSALRLVLHPGDHMHAVALFSDAGHFDLVLSHGEDGSHEHDAATGAALASNPSSSGDHVFHLTSDDLLSTAQRRLDLALAAASASGISRPLVPHTTRGPRVSTAPRARSLDSLSTVVLRI